MRRVFTCLLCLIVFAMVFAGCAPQVNSENVGKGVVTNLQSATTVSSDGSCDVTVNMQISLQEPPRALYYPLPKEAKNVSVNGSGVRTSLSGDVRNVNLTGQLRGAGNYTITIHYELPDAVSAQKKGKLVLNLDILNGFAYAIESMTFTVNLPGQPEKRPEFMSIYHQESVDTMMEISTEGSVMQCRFLERLKDHEFLSMSLEVTEGMFPQPLMKQWSLSADDVAMYVCALVALLYWFLFLRALPPSRVRRTQEPVGLTAGELGCSLTGRGVDFTMMVISWAQMGYLLIQLDENGRVLLHKRMDMGNERKEFENRWFRTLFGRRKTVDGTGHHFARLSAKAGKMVSGARDTYLPSSGNPIIFRGILAGIGMFGGVSLALSVFHDTVWQVIFGVLFGALGVALSWQMQATATHLHLRKNLPFWISLAASALWLLVGVFTGEGGVALFVVGCQWLGGLAMGYGGRRSETGRQNQADIVGLRRHLKTVSKEELQRILQNNPEYFYAMAPYAMAMGIDRAFARQMGQISLTECTYLTVSGQTPTTAREWNQCLRDVVQALDERQQRMALQKWFHR